MAFDPPPLRATRHCRHYDYQVGKGPKCAAGIVMDGPVLHCLPDAAKPSTCALREEYTDEERAAWGKYRQERMARTLVLVGAVPGDSIDQKKKSHWGESGTFKCPNCEVGTVRWARSSYNGHARAVCETLHCSEFIE